MVGDDPGVIQATVNVLVGDLSVDGKVIPMGGTKDHEMPTIRTFGSTTEDPNERIYDSTEKRTDDLYST